MYVLTAVRHDDVISDVFAWHTGDPASRTGHIHACFQPPGQSAITKPTIQTINFSGPLGERPSEFHERYCHSRLALFRPLFSVILPHYFFQYLTSAQAHWPVRKELVPLKLMGPLTSQNCPLTSQFFVQYLRDFLTVRIDPVKYKFLCMPESFSDPSVYTQETAACLKTMEPLIRDALLGAIVMTLSTSLQGTQCGRAVRQQQTVSQVPALVGFAR